MAKRSKEPTMLDGKKRHEIEQVVTELSEVLPRYWRQVFNGCVQEGFTQIEAMVLVQTYILSQGSTGGPPTKSIVTRRRKRRAARES